MSEFTRDEARAFLNAMRLTLHGKVGFKWLVERLSGLEGYIDQTAAENEQLNAFIEWSGARADYEAYVESRPQTPQGEADAALGDSETATP